jgi:hypothetical protein
MGQPGDRAAPEEASDFMASIFDSSKIFATYAGRIQFRDRIMGGIPKDPKIIEAWLRTKTGVTGEEEIRRATVRTLEELGIEVTADMSYEDMVKASEGVAGKKNTNGFKVTPEGFLYIESRYLKACLRECVNIEYAGTRLGPTKKGAKAYFAERAFINPDKVVLNHIGPDGTLVPIREPDGVELFIGHVTGPKGPQSTLTYHEYVNEAVIDFEAMVSHDCIGASMWESVWVTGQEIALGALRSQGFGRFDVLRWECTHAPKKKVVQTSEDGYTLEAVDPEVAEARANGKAAAGGSISVLVAGK